MRGPSLATRSAEGPMSVPRRDAPRSIGAPMILTFIGDIPILRSPKSGSHKRARARGWALAITLAGAGGLGRSRPARLTRASFLLVDEVVRVGLRQRVGRGAVQDVAVDVEARAVARAVPARLRLVPAH